MEGDVGAGVGGWPVGVAWQGGRWSWWEVQGQAGGYEGVAGAAGLSPLPAYRWGVEMSWQGQ